MYKKERFHSLLLIITLTLSFPSCSGTSGGDAEAGGGGPADAGERDTDVDSGGDADKANTETPAETGVDAADPGAPHPPDAGQVVPSPADRGSPDGWFVHWRKMESDGAGGYVLAREITHQDMQPIGRSAAQILVIGFDAQNGRYHRLKRVTTGSDYQRYGSYSYQDGHVHVSFEQNYSCAHPRSDGDYSTDAELDMDVSLDEDGNLWHWYAWGAWVYRPITEYDAHYVYNIPFCRTGCHCLCRSRDFFSDYTCYQ